MKKGKYIRKEYIFLLIGIGLGVLVFFIASSSGGNITGEFLSSDISKEEASSLVKKTFELTNDQEIEISAANKVGDLWKVIVKGQQNMREYYLTSDGRFLLSNPIEVESYINRTSKASEFIGCLEEEGMRFFGSDTNQTRLQIQILGGANLVNDIFYNLNNQITRYLVNNSVRSVPAFEINGEFYEGVRRIEWFENKTGCKYGG